jgi:hypothetical protein
MDRGQKFARLLQYLEKCSKSIMYHDEITSAVQRIRQVSFYKKIIDFTAAINIFV